MPRIGIIDDSPFWDHFRQGLRDLGYVVGQNIAIEYRSAEGNVDRLNRDVQRRLLLREVAENTDAERSRIDDAPRSAGIAGCPAWLFYRRQLQRDSDVSYGETDTPSFRKRAYLVAASRRGLVENGYVEALDYKCGVGQLAPASPSTSHAWDKIIGGRDKCVWLSLHHCGKYALEIVTRAHWNGNKL